MQMAVHCAEHAQWLKHQPKSKAQWASKWEAQAVHYQMKAAALYRTAREMLGTN